MGVLSIHIFSLAQSWEAPVHARVDLQDLTKLLHAHVSQGQQDRFIFRPEHCTFFVISHSSNIVYMMDIEMKKDMDSLSQLNLSNRKSGNSSFIGRRLSETFMPAVHELDANSNLGRVSFRPRARRTSFHRQLSLRLSRNKVNFIWVSFLMFFYLLVVCCRKHTRNIPVPGLIEYSR